MSNTHSMAGYQADLGNFSSTQPSRIRAERAVLSAEVTAILEKARAENRDVTPEEDRKLESLVSRMESCSRQLDQLAADERSTLIAALGDRTPSKPTQWKDQAGKPIHVLGKRDRWSDLPKRDGFEDGGSLGELVRCAITGNWRGASPSIRNAQSEGSNSAGGFLVPEELMRSIVDAARARSFVMQAGASTVLMNSDHMTLARVSTDPTFEVKSENSAFTGSDIAFDALGFTAKTVGTLITCSRELAEDAPNFEREVEGILARSFAAALDNIAVNGITSTSLDGILDWSTASGISETGSVGAIAWEDFGLAVADVQASNFQPNAYVLHPDIAYDLSVLASGDGSTAAKMWLGPPPNVAPLTQYVSTHIANTSAIVGDFTQFVWAIRQGALIEVSRTAGDAFSKHQVLIKLTWRGDTGAFRREAFHRLVGITT